MESGHARSVGLLAEDEHAVCEAVFAESAHRFEVAFQHLGLPGFERGYELLGSGGNGFGNFGLVCVIAHC
jgi:hypothetical protein